MTQSSKLLVVDDTQANIILIKRFLARVDVDIMEAERGEQALDLLNDYQFSLIILDIRMPGMNGIELAECIRERKDGRYIPLIFLSAHYSSEQATRKGIHTGAVDFMSKPIDWPTLINKVTLFVQLDQQAKRLIEEINQRKLMQEQLYAEKELLQITFESIADAVITINTESQLTYINPVAEALTEWEKRKAIGAPIDEVFKLVSFNKTNNKTEPIQCPVYLCLKGDQAVMWQEHRQLISRSGKKYSIKGSCAPIFNKQKKLIGAILVFTDVTRDQQLAKELAYQASHDPLTKLMNRREFSNRLQRIVATVKKHDKEHVMLFLDLDQFKVINDTCGHLAGDQLLQQISFLLEKQIRKRDCLARLGGDEFAIILEYCHLEQAIQVAEKLRQSISQLQFNFSDKIFKVGVSIGIMPITNAANSELEIMINADTACYAAKRAGRNQIRIFDVEDNVLYKQQDEMEWVSKIHYALENDTFELFYQPILGTNNPKEQCIEILLRVRLQEGTMALPGSFLPAAERYGLATLIDTHVVQLAFAWLSSHPIYLQKLTKISINLSGISLGNQEFLHFIVAELKNFSLPGDKICFEITESSLIENVVFANNFISVLKKQGCKFALDHFGKGLSSFAYLKELNVDYLKIDGGFVKNILNDPCDKALVNSMHEMGHILGKKTIAECVESQALVESLQAMGVDYLQGYAIGKPQAISTLDTA